MACKNSHTQIINPKPNTMLLTQNLFFSPPVEFFSMGKCSQNTRVGPIFGRFEKNNSRSRSCGKVGVNFNGYTYFTAPHHPLESELPSLHADSDTDGSGIGIDKFFDGKNIFITGATGLLGKGLLLFYLYYFLFKLITSYAACYLLDMLLFWQQL